MIDKITRDKILKLRSEGFTYKEIQKQLKFIIPKSTFSYICSQAKLPVYYHDKIKKLNKENLKKAQAAAVKANKAKRQIFLEQIERKNKSFLGKIDKDVAKIALAMLYLGEGAKWKSHKGLMLGSSDSGIIILYLKLLKYCYNINKDKLSCRVMHRADQDINNLEEFWAKVTGVSRTRFYKTKPDSRTIGKPTKNIKYKGVCSVMCGGTAIQLELENLTKQIGACSLEEKRMHGMHQTASSSLARSKL